MPRKFSGNRGRINIAGGKIKQVWRPKQKPSLPPPWTELPSDITANILQRLTPIEILENAQRVCTTWRSVCKDPSMWRVIDMHLHSYEDQRSYDLNKSCRHAVDRSQGQLVSINLDYFASDELLDRIAKSCEKLKRLQLACCDELNHEALIEAIKKLPQLEELHIIGFCLSDKTVEIIGRSCPSLKSFAFNYQPCFIKKDNLDAMAIAKSMPELRHLQLLRNELTNEGLKAILDACPHLESLDLRRCRYVKLTGDLAKMCSTRIKDLRYPDESTLDYALHENAYEYGYPYPYFIDYEDFDINIDNYHLLYDDFTRLDHEDYLFDGNEDFPFFF